MTVFIIHEIFFASAFLKIGECHIQLHETFRPIAYEQIKYLMDYNI